MRMITKFCDLYGKFTEVQLENIFIIGATIHQTFVVYELILY